MQYYFYINGLLSKAFSADGRQISNNVTAVLGESLVIVPLCPPPIPLYTVRSRPVLRADTPPVCLLDCLDYRQLAHCVPASSGDKQGRQGTVSAAKKPHCRRNVSYFSTIRFSEITHI
jgi:hypothetical protein